MKLFIAICGLAIGVGAFAAIVTKETPQRYDLRELNGAVIAQYDTHAECVVAAAALLAPSGLPAQRYECATSVLVDVTGVCDVPKPALPANTELQLIAQQDPKDDTVWYSWVTGIVPTDYPTCWKVGLVQQQPPFEVADWSTPGYVPPLDPGALDGEKQ